MILFSKTVRWTGKNGELFSMASFMKDNIDMVGVMSSLNFGNFQLVYCSDNTIPMGENDIKITKDNVPRIRKKLSMSDLTEDQISELSDNPKKWIRAFVDHMVPRIRDKSLSIGPYKISKTGE